MKLPAAQERVLERLARVLPESFYLAGGVAALAHLGHRSSRDLDLFSSDDPMELVTALEREPGSTIVNRAEGTLQLEVDGVPVSLLAYRYPLLSPPQRVPGWVVPIASLDDLASMKLSAIGGRVGGQVR